MARLSLLFAALFGLLAVGVGAAGAHLVDPADAQALRWLTTAGSYAGWHAVAVLGIGLYLRQARQVERLLALAALFLILGLILFCGSLWVMALGGPAGLSSVTPVGGIAFLLGWLCLGMWGVLGR